MGLIQIARPWTRQPQLARANYQDPIAKGLCFLWTGTNGRNEAISGLSVDVFSAGRNGSPYGLVADCATGQRNIEWAKQFVTTSDGAGTGDFTVLVISNPKSVSSVGHMLAQKNDAAGAPYSQFALLSNSNASASASAGSVCFFTYSSSGTAVVSDFAINGLWHVWVGVRRGTTIELYRDGIQLATNSGTVRTVSQSNRYLALGSRGNGTTEAFADDILGAAAWNRALSAGELAALRSIPDFWRVFAPHQQRIFFGAAAGLPTLTALSISNITTSGATLTVSA